MYKSPKTVKKDIMTTNRALLREFLVGFWVVF